MKDNPERALQEAETWLASAMHSLAGAEGDEAMANVCCAQAIHAIIRANDALSLKFVGHKPTRHDDAAIVFMKIAGEGKLPEDAAGFRALVADAMRDKSGADYGKRSFSYGDARGYVERAEDFISMVKEALGL